MDVHVVVGFLEQVLGGFFLVKGDEVEVLRFVILVPVHGPLDLDDVGFLEQVLGGHFLDLDLLAFA